MTDLDPRKYTTSEDDSVPIKVQLNDQKFVFNPLDKPSCGLVRWQQAPQFPSLGAPLYVPLAVPRWKEKYDQIQGTILITLDIQLTPYVTHYVQRDPSQTAPSYSTLNACPIYAEFNINTVSTAQAIGIVSYFQDYSLNDYQTNFGSAAVQYIENPLIGHGSFINIRPRSERLLPNTANCSRFGMWLNPGVANRLVISNLPLDIGTSAQIGLYLTNFANTVEMVETSVGLNYSVHMDFNHVKPAPSSDMTQEDIYKSSTSDFIVIDLLEEIAEQVNPSSSYPNASS